MAKRDDVPLKAAKSLIRKAKVIAAYEGITLAAYISKIIAARIERDWLATTQKMTKETKSPRGNKTDKEEAKDE